MERRRGGEGGETERKRDKLAVEREREQYVMDAPVLLLTFRHELGKLYSFAISVCSSCSVSIHRVLQHAHTCTCIVLSLVIT